jgi:lysyl-tRNA synthetase class II
MAKDAEPLETLSVNAERAVKQAEQVVEKTVDQTRGPLDNYFSFMQKAFSFYPVDGTELGEKMNRYTAQNISAAQDFVHKLSQAKDLQDIIRIQTEFMQTQFSVLAEQTKSLTEAFTKVPISTMSRSVSRRPSAA